LHAQSELPGAEIPEGVFTVVSQSRNLPGKHRESSVGRCCALGKTGVGRGQRRLPAQRGDLDGSDREVAAPRQGGFLSCDVVFLVNKKIWKPQRTRSHTKVFLVFPWCPLV